MYGYMGKFLLVDLSNESFEERVLDETVARQFIGGYGIGARILYDLMKPGTDPLGPESVIGFMTGPLTGTAAYLSGRYTVVCKSPVTGGWNDANSGGYFGNELKKSGFDGVFIRGASKKPVYIWIKEGRYEIRDAAGLWGKDIVETDLYLKNELKDDKIRAAVIGPAGEKRSLISAVMNDGHRAAGRGGCGAVMGSKNLKALVVRGTAEVPVADPEGLKEANQYISNTMKTGPMAEVVKGFSTFGTTIATGASILSGDTPVKNWAGTGITDIGTKNATNLDGSGTDPKYRKKKYACSRCPVGCGAIYNAENSRYPVGETGRPEYETASAFGPLVLNSDPDVLIKCNHICNIYGLDTISAGGTVAWAIECYENGLLTENETGGIDLTWGNGEAIITATQVMADQSTEFGKLLALGSATASKKIGKGSEYLQTVNGIELPYHDPRYTPGFARTYQMDPTPARHVKGGRGLATGMKEAEVRYNTENVGQEDMEFSAGTEIVNSVGLCMFNDLTGVDNIAGRLMGPVTGWDFTREEQLKTGLRIYNMRHAFSLREGVTPADRKLPGRCVGEPPLESGPLENITVDHQKLTNSFLNAMGWDKTTWRPGRRTLEKLGGLDDVIEDLDLV